MAEVTEMTSVSPVIPPPNGNEKKRPRGRPQKCRECGEAINPLVAHVCAPDPEDAPDEAQTSGDQDFWMKLASFTTEDWNQHIAYLYRCGPIIDRKSAGKPANLQRYSTAFDREDIMKEHGSGAYRIDLCRLDPASGKSFRVAQERFSIINPKYPPNVPPGDWVDDKANEVWRWGAPASTQGTATIPGYPPGFDMLKIQEREEKMFNRGLELAKVMAPPAKDDSAMTGLLTTLINATLNRPEPPKPDDSSNKAFMAFLEKQNDRMAEELKEMRQRINTPAAPPPNLLDQVKDLKPLVSEFAGMFAERTGKEAWWQGPLEKLMESVPDVIDLVKTGQNSHQYQPGATTQQNFTPQLTSAATAQPAAAPAPQTNGQPPAAQPELSDEQKKVKIAFDKWGPHLQYIMPFMVDEFKMDEGGHGGYYFRDWYLSRNSAVRWKELERELGPELMLLYMTQHPFLKEHMAPPERAALFVGEFFTAVGEEKDVMEEPVVAAQGETRE
jgi:hypothetical protein